MNNDAEHITQRQLEIIEQYVLNGMSKADCRAFEERMKDDEKLRQAVAYYQELIEGVETTSLKAKLDDFHAEIEKEKPQDEQSTSRSYIKYLAAASVVLVIGIAVWLFAFQQSPQEKLYAAYFKPDPGLITPMGSTDHYEFYAGMIAYKQEHYEEAIKKWKPLLQAKAHNDTLNYFLGVAQLAVGDEDKALPYLKTSVRTSGSVFKEDAYFYMGLAYLKEGDRRAAIQALQQTSSDRAARLRAELEKQK